MTDIDASGTLFVEDFHDGLAIGDRWRYVEAPGFVSDDGDVRRSGAGVSIAPPARHGTTGEPMFTKEAAGFAGHLKWLVFTPDGVSTAAGPVRVSFRASARCFGTDAHPYGPAVEDSDADFRLCAATLNVLDFSTGLVFDFWLTNTTIVPLYERIRPPEVPYEYAAFTSYATPVARTPDAVHELAIVVDAARSTVQWEVDGVVVASVEHIGRPAAHWTSVLDHGGTPETVVPQQVQLGLGLMTLLDARLVPSGDGLVDIGAQVVQPTAFHADGPTLFGQGAQLDVERIEVRAL